jgi:RNA polymerase sigma-70 factor (ECF subfamily)
VPRQPPSDIAFARLVQDEREPLEAYVRSLGASPEDAEELAASALLVSYRARAMQATDHATTRGELQDIALTLWRQLQRRNRRSEPPEGLTEPPPVVADATQQVEIAEDARSLLRGMSRLPPMQRRALYLREIRGLSYAEIAEELSASVPAVESALHRARQTLGRFGSPRLVRGLVFAPLLLMRRGLDHAVDVVTQLTAAKLAVPAAIVLGTGGITAGTTYELFAGTDGPEPVAIADGGRLQPPPAHQHAGGPLRGPGWRLPSTVRVAPKARDEDSTPGRSAAPAQRAAGSTAQASAAAAAGGVRASSTTASVPGAPAAPASASSAVSAAASGSGTLAVSDASGAHAAPAPPSAARTNAARRGRASPGTAASAARLQAPAQHGGRTPARSGGGVVNGPRQPGSGGHRRGGGGGPRHRHGHAGS